MRIILHSCRFCVVFISSVSSLLVLLLILDVSKYTDDRYLLIQSSLQYSDNKYAATTWLYNACSPAVGEGRQVLASLPAVHTTFPITDKSSEDCFEERRPEDFYEPLPVCQKLFEEEKLTAEEEKWIIETNIWKGDQPKRLLDKTGNCTWVRDEFSNNFFVSAEEKAFPIAYAINLNKYPEQILRFLKVIYRPHNIHCLHYDIKADGVTKQAMHNIASCLGNVIIPRKVENVYRGWHTLVDAHFNCFSDLLLARGEYPWRYVITLCSKELPLRTNAEIIAMLKPLKGTSAIKLSEVGKDRNKFRWTWTLNTWTGWITKKGSRSSPIPYNLEVYKSSAYLGLSYQFVEHILCSPVGKALREYMKDILVPEESIYAMLFMQPNTPGGYRNDQKNNPFILSSAIWLNPLSRISRLFHHSSCSGWGEHNICILSAKDLHRVSYRPGVSSYGAARRIYNGKDRGPLFHNRFNLEWDSVVMECMERELNRRNRIEYTNACFGS